MAILQVIKHTFLDNSGNPLSGGKVYTYDAGTSTPRNTYTDQGAGTPNANPVILNTRGEASIWFSGSYKVVVKDSADVTIYTVDNIQDPATGFVTLAGVETLTNKTLISPVISSPTITGAGVITAATGAFTETITASGLISANGGITAPSGQVIRGNTAIGETTASAVVGVASSSGTGVYGLSGSSYGVYGISSSNIGVYGSSTSGAGVYGSSSSAAGVYGISGSSYGVYGISSSNIGVYGISTTSGAGVYGISTSGNGVYGISTSGNGVYGISTSGNGVYCNSSTGMPLRINPGAAPTTNLLDGGFYCSTTGQPYVRISGVWRSINVT